MRSLVLLLAASLITFSGCTEPQTPIDPVQGADGGNETADPTPPATETPSNGSNEPTNAAPVANLTADFLNGTAPFQVSFTVDGSDADGDALAWTLAANGTALANGTSVPATYNHTFEVAGLFNVTLTVDDGQALSHAALQVEIEAALPKGPEPVTLSGSVMAASTPVGSMLGADQCAGWNGDENGLDCYWWPADAAWAGRPYTGTGTNLYAHWLSSCSTDAAEMALHAVGEAQVVPEGAGCVVAFLYAATASGALSLTIE